MNNTDFSQRHIGITLSDEKAMLKIMGLNTLNELIDNTIPEKIRLKKTLKLSEPLSENEYLKKIKQIASKNKIFKSHIGQGYYETIVPSVIFRNIFENPSWYTSYTPYQAEISQGRLEAMLNYQTAIVGLTKMELANASLLDEGTAAAEAMLMSFNLRSRKAVKNNTLKFFVDENIFSQTLAVIETRAIPFDIEIIKGSFKSVSLDDSFFGSIVQYPAADGKVEAYSEFIEQAHRHEIKVSVVADILSLALLTPPGEWGADIVVGSTQRFGIPMGYGGPHAAYFATLEKYKRHIPGRIIGVSKDANGKPALRMALQTREQHIKREKATSNICTAQALLATMAGMYLVYHGPDKLKDIAADIHSKAVFVNQALEELGFEQENKIFFDTLKINVKDNKILHKIKTIAESYKINFFYPDDTHVQISFNETDTIDDIYHIVDIFAQQTDTKTITKNYEHKINIPRYFIRTSEFLTEDVFNSYHSETEMMRYIKRLERKDISLTHSMTPLGSCTMKLNAATEMLPLSWPEFAYIHPFAPSEQTKGYAQIIDELGEDLKIITGFDAITFQPNSGASGEYTGLMLIRAYHEDQGQSHRNVVLIPSSAHGTNPASSVMAGNKVIVVGCDKKGNIDLEDLKQKAKEHKDNLAAFVVTYPSTHGVYEEQIKEMTEIIHNYGGLVYMDGANMNAQVGLTNPAAIGADVCHLNLHKTFAIPHGGGGPGVGPVAVNKKLSAYLPTNPIVSINDNSKAIKAVSSAPYGSAYILPISHAYIKMMGEKGLTRASKVAILSANYIAHTLDNYYDVLYTGNNNTVAHELILNCHAIKTETGISELDIAKRLMDYGFHAPTLSFPVHGTLMVEPTESESLSELNRFIEAMISIYKEIMDIKNGKMPKDDNLLINAPHSVEILIANNWTHPYSREIAAFPLPWIRENKFFPATSRIDDAYGDRNLFCTCLPLEEYKKNKIVIDVNRI
ncbi:MAG TPA: aminomethyl-transferring glycine dehydrogenase [Bacteroidales bacterium]|nr:aminomethyl-transferring glycine dehydrogenase [Bacteroidales bacterium]